MSLVVGNSTEQFKIGLHVISNLADRGQIPASIAVVWCAPHGDHVLVVEMVFIPFIHQLMCSRDEGKVIDMAEFFCHSISEEPA